MTNGSIDEVLVKEEQRIILEITRLQARLVSIRALLGSAPPVTPAAELPASHLTPRDEATAETVLEKLRAHGSAGATRGELAEETGYERARISAILGVLRVKKQAKLRGTRALARWYAK